MRAELFRSALAALLVATASPAVAETILFVGNSFTQGAHSPAVRYRAETVTDLNGDGYGGVPALFKRFTEQAGLDYQVSLETSGGKDLAWHWDQKRALLDRAWDHVVLQDYSTLNQARPGDPTNTIDYVGRFARLFAARNPAVKVGLNATWSRADLAYRGATPWTGKPIETMARDLKRGYDQAAQASPTRTFVHPVGTAFNCAFTAGVADPNPYDGVSFGKLDLWTYDQYHASAAGYYLEALTIFAGVTGKDPRTLGRAERAAADLGLSANQAVQLQEIAWAATRPGPACG